MHHRARKKVVKKGPYECTKLYNMLTWTYCQNSLMLTLWCISICVYPRNSLIQIGRLLHHMTSKEQLRIGQFDCKELYNMLSWNHCWTSSILALWCNFISVYQGAPSTELCSRRRVVASQLVISIYTHQTLFLNQFHTSHKFNFILVTKELHALSMVCLWSFLVDMVEIASFCQYRMEF